MTRKAEAPAQEAVDPDGVEIASLPEVGKGDPRDDEALDA